MSSLISVGAQVGFQIIRFYFCKSLEKGDFTNEQILAIVENKLSSILKDLECLKLQKLRSAAFLVKSGIHVYSAGDIEEARRNFDKAEMDAIEGFSTAPDVEWKIFAVKIAICSMIWRKIILVPSHLINIDSVSKQVLLQTRRLLDDPGVINNIKTHLTGSLLSGINKSRRIDLINKIVAVDSASRMVLFENFLEILPDSEIHLDSGTNVSLLSLSNFIPDLVPYSPRQCSSFRPIPAIKLWKNLSCHINEGINKSEMTSQGFDSVDTCVYIAQRQWIDFHSTTKKGAGSIQSFRIPYMISEFDSIQLTEFELVYVCFTLMYQSLNNIAPDITVMFEYNKYPISFTSIKPHGRSYSQFNIFFYRSDKLLKDLNSSDLRNNEKNLMLSISCREDMVFSTISMCCHLKLKNYRYMEHGSIHNTLNIDV